MNQLNDDGIRAFDGAGVSRIVDLRSEWECEQFPSPFMPDDRWHKVPLSDPTDPDVSSLDLYEQYRILVDDYGTRISRSVSAVADAPDGCVVLTCHAGADRTGIVTALVLDVVGVPRDLIAEDYAMAPVQRSRSELPEAAAPKRGTMATLLEHMTDVHNGTQSYLQACGVTAAQIGALTERLLVP